MYTFSWLGCAIIQLPELLLVSCSNFKKIFIRTYGPNVNASDASASLFTVKKVNGGPNKQLINLTEEVSSIIDEKISDVKAELLDLINKTRANVTCQDI